MARFSSPEELSGHFLAPNDATVTCLMSAASWPAPNLSIPALVRLALLSRHRAAGFVSDRFIPSVSLGGPRICEGGDVHQIVGDDTETDPTVHAVFTMVTTAVESMPAFQHTDAAFAADAPPLSPT
jgi:hypothetical protein